MIIPSWYSRSTVDVVMHSCLLESHWEITMIFLFTVCYRRQNTKGPLSKPKKNLCYRRLLGWSLNLKGLRLSSNSDTSCVRCGTHSNEWVLCVTSGFVLHFNQKEHQHHHWSPLITISHPFITINHPFITINHPFITIYHHESAIIGCWVYVLTHIISQHFSIISRNFWPFPTSLNLW